MKWKLLSRMTLFVAFTIVLALSLQGHATTILARSLDDLIFDADAVVHARVASQKSHRQEDGRVVTDVELAIERYLVGQGPQRVSLRILGGRIGNLETRAIGAPAFVDGDETVLFLRQIDAQTSGLSFRLVGMTLGVFKLQFDQVTNLPYVIRDLLDISIMGEAQTRQSQWVRPDVSFFMAYDTFVATVQERARIVR